jgi:hypothetical protein
LCSFNELEKLRLRDIAATIGLPSVGIQIGQSNRNVGILANRPDTFGQSFKKIRVTRAFRHEAGKGKKRDAQLDRGRSKKAFAVDAADTY